mgnify:CR=1 FL=1
MALDIFVSYPRSLVDGHAGFSVFAGAHVLNLVLNLLNLVLNLVLQSAVASVLSSSVYPYTGNTRTRTP